MEKNTLQSTATILPNLTFRLGRGEGGGLVEGEGSEKVHFEKNNLTSYLGGG